MDALNGDRSNEHTACVEKKGMAGIVLQKPRHWDVCFLDKRTNRCVLITVRTHKPSLHVIST